jgi:hypothetical protein
MPGSRESGDYRLVEATAIPNLRTSAKELAETTCGGI